jgi:hypothetical protein
MENKIKEFLNKKIEHITNTYHCNCYLEINPMNAKYVLAVNSKIVFNSYQFESYKKELMIEFKSSFNDDLIITDESINNYYF